MADNRRMPNPHIDRLEPRRLFAVAGLDTSFGDKGYASRTADEHFVALSGNGLLTEHVNGETPGRSTTIRRYDERGRLARGFTPIVIADDTLATTADSQGRPVAADAGDNGGVTLRRFTLNGAADKSFAKTGSTTAYPAGQTDFYDNATVLDIATGPDDSIYVLTMLSRTFRNTSNVAVTKWTAAGKLDGSFGENGTATFAKFGVTFGKQGRLFVDASGRVLIETPTTKNDASPFVVRRLTPAGRTDTTYADGGDLSVDLDVRYDASIAVDGVGRLLLVDVVPTRTTDRGRVVRYTDRGRLDRTFGGRGSVIPVDNSDTAVSSEHRVLPLGDGTIFAQLGPRVVHLTASGEVMRRENFEVPEDVTLAGISRLGAILADDARLPVDAVAKLAPTPAVSQTRDGTLRLEGTNGDDAFRVQPVGPPGRLEVRVAGERVGVFNGVTAITATLYRGDDLLQAGGVSVPVTVQTGDGSDVIATGAAADTIRFAGGKTVVDAGGGGGTIESGLAGGDDVVLGHGGRRDVWHVELGGTPRVELSGGSGTVDVGRAQSSRLTLGFFRGVSVSGSGGDDFIATGRGNDVITPAGGHDTVDTGAGDDYVGNDSSADNGDDDLYVLGPGNDVVRDPVGNNTVYGGDGDDSIYTGAGNDSLFGNGGNDRLSAGEGDDTLRAGDARVPSAFNRLDGGAGTDRFFREGDRDALSLLEVELSA